RASVSLGDYVRRTEANREPERARAAAVREEVGALHERDSGRLRAREQPPCVLREIEPDEVAAFGPATPGALGHLALERVEHRVPPCAKQAAHALEVRLEVAAPD